MRTIKLKATTRSRTAFGQLMLTNESIIWLSAVLALPLLFIPAFPNLNALVVADDSYYYYNVARNFVEWGWVTFDGRTHASGYHPLFMAVCVAVYAVAGDLLPNAISLVSAAGFLVYVYFCGRIVRSLTLTHQQSALFALMLVANPALMTSAWLVGLEAILTLPLLAAFMHLCIEAQRDDTCAESLVWRAAGVNVLLFFSRLDIVIVTAPLFAFAFRRIPKRMVAAAAVSAVLPLGFLGLHYLHFGSAIPSSASAFRLLLRPIEERAAQPWLNTGLYLDFPHHIARFAFNTGKSIRFAMGIGEGFASVNQERAVAIVMMLLLAAALRRGVSWRGVKHFMRDPLVKLASVATLTTVILIYVGTVRLNYIRPWYHGVYAPIMALAFWMIARPSILDVRIRVPIFCLYAVAVAAIAAVMAFAPPTRAVWPVARTTVATEAVMLTEGERIGSFNAGIYGWAANTRIVNLDGLANQNAYRALSRKELATYIWEGEGLRFLLDVEPADRVASMINLNDKGSIHLSLEEIRSWRDGPYVHRLWRVSRN